MLWALERGVAADAFVIYTDSETMVRRGASCGGATQVPRGDGYPCTIGGGRHAGEPFSIADPNDAGMLDGRGLTPAHRARLLSLCRATWRMLVIAERPSRNGWGRISYSVPQRFARFEHMAHALPCLGLLGEEAHHLNFQPIEVAQGHLGGLAQVAARQHIGNL